MNGVSLTYKSLQNALQLLHRKAKLSAVNLIQRKLIESTLLINVATNNDLCDVPFNLEKW